MIEIRLNFFLSLKYPFSQDFLTEVERERIKGRLEFLVLVLVVIGLALQNNILPIGEDGCGEVRVGE